MTVRELIDALSTMDDSLPVLAASDPGCDQKRVAYALRPNAGDPEEDYVMIAGEFDD